MRKIFATMCFVAAMLIVGNADAQLLYKITGKKLKQPSYIVGTMHLAPGSFAEEINGASSALAAVQQVYGEIDISELEALQSPEMQASMAEQMRLPKGMTLKKLLGKERYARLNEVMLRVLGVDMKNPAVGMSMYNLTPSALAVTLTQVVYLKQVPGFNPADQLDMYFQRAAREAGKRTGGLESADFQMEMLYSQDSLDEQVKDLMCFLDQLENSISQTRRLLQAYYSEDIQQIEKIVSEADTTQSDCGTGDEAMDALLDNRNDEWIKQMPKVMKAAPTLFVVGCAHLVGENGILQMLRKKGYTVEPIEPTKTIAEGGTFRLEVRRAPRYVYESSNMLILDEVGRCELIVSPASLAQQALQYAQPIAGRADAEYHLMQSDGYSPEYRFILQSKSPELDYGGLFDTMMARGWVTVDTLPSEPAFAMTIADTALFLASTQEQQNGQPHNSCYMICRAWLQPNLPVVGLHTDKLWERAIEGEIPKMTTIDKARGWLRGFGLDLVPAGRNLIRHTVKNARDPFGE